MLRAQLSEIQGWLTPPPGSSSRPGPSRAQASGMDFGYFLSSPAPKHRSAQGGWHEGMHCLARPLPSDTGGQACTCTRQDGGHSSQGHGSSRPAEPLLQGLPPRAAAGLSWAPRDSRGVGQLLSNCPGNGDERPQRPGPKRPVETSSQREGTASPAPPPAPPQPAALLLQELCSISHTTPGRVQLLQVYFTFPSNKSRCKQGLFHINILTGFWFFFWSNK